MSLYYMDVETTGFNPEQDKNGVIIVLMGIMIIGLFSNNVLAITSLEGKPEITQCIQEQDLMSGQNKVVSFKVKNNANVNNVEFYSSIKCNQGAVAWGSNFNIDGLETKTITVEINPSNQNQNILSGTCTLKVTDLKSTLSDSCDFNIKVAYESGIICSPNELYCDRNQENILKCNEQGDNKILFKECDSGCGYNNGGADCNKDIIDNLRNKNQIYLAVIIGIIGIILLIILLKNLLTPNKIEERENE